MILVRRTTPIIRLNMLHWILSREIDWFRTCIRAFEQDLLDK